MTDALWPGRPALEDVTGAAGVSRATVSRVISGVRNVDPAIQEAVRQAVSATGYASDRAARSLLPRRTDAIALVVSGTRAAAGPEGAGPAGEGALHRSGLRRPVLRPGADRGRQLSAAARDAPGAGARTDPAGAGRGGGVPAAGQRRRGAHRLEPLPGPPAGSDHRGRAPAVLYARPAGPARISCADLVHRDGARPAAEYLLARGCRRLATVSGPAGHIRRAGEAGRLPGNAGAARASPAPFVEERFTQESGEAAMEHLLAERPGPDGVSAGNDLMATDACQVLREHGRRVPKDASVVGSTTAAPPRPVGRRSRRCGSRWRR